MAISNSEIDSAARETSRKRKRGEVQFRPSPSRWKSLTEQNTYSSKFLEALRRVRRSHPPAPLPPRSRAVREAADRALASAARGRSHWSRAVLFSGRSNLKPVRRKAPVIGSRAANRSGSVSRVQEKKKKKKKQPVLEKKAKILGRLVPGCRKLSFPTLLEEASDYIAALEMQVRAMTALTEILAASGSGAGAPIFMGPSGS